MSLNEKGSETAESLVVALKEENLHLRDLIRRLCHEIRSPLANLQGFSKELERDISEIQKRLNEHAPQNKTERLDELLNVHVPESLAFIQDANRRIDALLSGTNAYLRLHRLAVRREKCNTEKIIKSLVNALQVTLAEIKATVQVQEPLPNCAGDPDMLVLVFRSLLENAIHFRHPDRPLKIEISGALEREQVLYSVKDNGMGLAPEQLSRIFELFVRGSSGQTGVGMGLPMARRMLEMQGGSIWAVSELGQGSTMYVALKGETVDDSPV